MPPSYPLDAGNHEIAVARIEGDTGVHTLIEERMEPKKLYAATDRLSQSELVTLALQGYFGQPPLLTSTA